MIRVLIADDHAVVREGLKRIVAGNADMEVTAEAASGQEAREAQCERAVCSRMRSSVPRETMRSGAPNANTDRPA